MINLMKKDTFYKNLILGLLVYFVICWKFPFYMLLLCVDLPEDAIVLKRQVSYTDVYNEHILAELVFVGDLGYDTVRETILAENRTLIRKNVLMDWHIMERAMVEEWDDYCISLKEMNELAAQKGRGNWYYVSLNMAVPTLILVRIASFIVIFTVITCFWVAKRKKGDTYEKIEQC